VFSEPHEQIGVAPAREARAVRIIRSHIRALFLAGILAIGMVVTMTTGPSASALETTTTTGAPTAKATPVVTPTPAPATTTTKKPSTSTTKKPSTSTTAPEASTVPSTRAPSTTTTAPAVLAPTSSTTSPPETTGDGMSADRKLQLVVGGLVVVGAGIGLLTFLYWRRTRPPEINTALNALADLELAAMTAPATASVGSDTAPTPAVGDVATEAVVGSVESASSVELPGTPSAVAGAGSGVRILGPIAAAGIVAAGEARPAATDEPARVVTVGDTIGDSAGEVIPGPAATIASPIVTAFNGDVVTQIAESLSAPATPVGTDAEPSDEVIEIPSPVAVIGPIAAQRPVVDASALDSPETEMLTIITIEDLANRAAESAVAGVQASTPAEPEDGGDHG